MLALKGRSSQVTTGLCRASEKLLEEGDDDLITAKRRITVE
jgi:hypothetical protein